MTITFDNNEKIISADYDVKQFYNVKDIVIIIPEENTIEDNDSYALLDSQKFFLRKEESEENYKLLLKEEAFKGATKFQLVIKGNKSNLLNINFNPYTPFSIIYNLFFEKITDDMYMETTKEETYKMIKGIFLSAICMFEFPRVDVFNYDLDKEVYNIALSHEEVDIIATYMITAWLGQQLASVELTRMKYSGSDFKFTSQANHMAKLLSLKKDYERLGFHLQRLYKRRKADDKGVMRSTFSSIMESSFNRRDDL